jgi:hypothetical protein
MAVSWGSTGVRLIALLAAISLAATGAKNARAADGATGLFSLRLEPSKPVYHVGEVIELRLKIHNITDQTYYIKIAAPWQLCKLDVTTEQGQLLTPQGVPRAYEIGPSPDAYLRKMSPRMTFVATYDALPNSGVMRDWAKVDYWGYHLNAPGKYTITANPTISGFQNDHPWFTTSSRDRSNAVEIEIQE